MSDRNPRPPGQPRPSKTAVDANPRRNNSTKPANKSTNKSNSHEKSNQNSNDQESTDVFANTQKMKAGDRTLLLCMDNESGSSSNIAAGKSFEISIPDIFSAATGSLDTMSTTIGITLSEDSADRALQGLSADQEASENKIDAPIEDIKPVVPVPTAIPPQAAKRRMSRSEQFSVLEKTIPIKLDHQMRKSVVTAMVDMNVWDEDDDDDIDSIGANSNKSKKAAPSSSQPAKNQKPNSISNTSDGRKKGAVSNSHVGDYNKGSVQSLGGTSSSSAGVTAAAGNTVSTTASTTAVSTAVKTKPSAITTTSSADASTLTSPTAAAISSARDKVPMQRPNQIPINEQAQQRDERQRLERDAVRDTIVNKAVQFLVDLNKKQDLELQQQVTIQPQQQLSNVNALLNKSPKEIKSFTIKKFTTSIVDRALKRGKNFFNKEVEKHKIEEWKYHRRRAQAARFLSRAWRRHCGRIDVRKVLAMGRASIHAKKVAEIEEQYEFRIRMTQRRLLEQSYHKEWLDEQREFPTFPVTKEVEQREAGPISVNEEGLAMSRADAKLFAQDFEHLRPDLAPFSTKINGLIASSLQDVKRTVAKKQLLERSMELFAGEAYQASVRSMNRSRLSSMSGGDEHSSSAAANKDKDVVTHSAVSSPRIPSTPRSPRTPKTPRTVGIGASMAASTRTFDFPATPMSLPFPMSPVSMSAQTPRASLVRMRAEDASSELMTQLSLPQRLLDRSNSSLRAASLVGWEEMARLDNMPSIEEIKKTGAGKSSAAYKVLERLCGLTEEDIMRRKMERLKAGAEEVSLSNSKFLFI